jgi:hypothetical protein
LASGAMEYLGQKAPTNAEEKVHEQKQPTNLGEQ